MGVLGLIAPYEAESLMMICTLTGWFLIGKLSGCVEAWKLRTALKTKIATLDQQHGSAMMRQDAVASQFFEEESESCGAVCPEERDLQKDQWTSLLENYGVFDAPAGAWAGKKFE